MPTTDYSYIKSYNLYDIKVKSANSEAFKKEILKLNPDVILVGTWCERLKKEIINLPKIAFINAHPSLLPKYRGPNPYFWVIKNQEQVSGVTFHLIGDKYDNGAILAQEEVKIFPSDTGKSLKERTVLTARGVVCELLKDLSEDIIIPLQQREDKASYYSYPDDLELDFSKSAEENYALIRAIYPWGLTYFYHNDKCFAVFHDGVEIAENNTEYTESGTVVGVDAKSEKISVLCGNNKVIVLKIKHYNKCDRPFTGNYIKSELKTGMVV